jgi:hypothetical protein
MTQSASISNFSEENPGQEGMDQTEQDNAGDASDSNLPNSETSSLNMPSSESSNLISPLSESSNLISPTSESSNLVPNSETTISISDASPLSEEESAENNKNGINIPEPENNNKGTFL